MDVAVFRMRMERCRAVARALDIASTLHPAAELVPGWPGRVLRAATALDSSHVERLVNLAFSRWHTFDSTMVRQLAKGRECVTLGKDRWMFADFHGVPVVWQPGWNDSWVWAPLPRGELLALAYGGGPCAVVADNTRGGGFTLAADDTTIPSTLAEQAVDAITKTRRAGSCRAWLFVGPPGAGKTTIARQLVQEIGRGSWVQLGTDVLSKPEVWQLVHEIRPEAIFLDDIDTAAEDIDRSLRTGMQVARGYAKVIAATANTTTDLRGSMLRPGRFDEDPVHVATLSRPVVAEIGYALPADVLDQAIQAGLLAAYVHELNYRTLDGRDPREELPHLVERMLAAGDR